MKYFVYASAESIDTLWEKVNQLMPHGFEPFGTVYHDYAEDYYYQTLRRNVPAGLTREQAYHQFWEEFGEWAIAPNDDDEEIEEADNDDILFAEKGMLTQGSYTLITSTLGNKSDDDSDDDIDDEEILSPKPTKRR